MIDQKNGDAKAPYFLRSTIDEKTPKKVFYFSIYSKQLIPHELDSYFKKMTKKRENTKVNDLKVVSGGALSAYETQES